MTNPASIHAEPRRGTRRRGKAGGDEQRRFAVRVRLFVATLLALGFAGGFVSARFMETDPRPSLDRIFQPNNPNWHGALYSGGVACRTLLDLSADPRWSADYCAR
jgi:hypothetical protein